jgi:hypothetical protein
VPVIKECKPQCIMMRDGFTECPIGICIEDKAWSRHGLPTNPVWRAPIAYVHGNDAATGMEYGHSATPPSEDGQQHSTMPVYARTGSLPWQSR